VSAGLSVLFLPTNGFLIKPCSTGTDMPRVLGLASALLYLLSAMLAVWVAYDRPAAQTKFVLMASAPLCVLALNWLCRGKKEVVPKVIGSMSACMVVTLGLSFILFGSPPSGPTSNVLVILLPLSLAAAPTTVMQFQALPGLAAVGCWITGLTALVLTIERSAWLAFFASLLGTGLICWLSHNKGLRRLSHAVLACVLLGLCACSAFLLLASREFLQLSLPAPLFQRLPLWHDAMDLIGDYPFTGIGLSVTGMVFSTYVFLLHVPYQSQAHNLFLQIALEQGVLGLVAFLGMSVACGWSLLVAFREKGASLELGAITASFVALLVYGIFDSEGYVSPLIPVLFLPFVCVWFFPSARTPECPKSRTVSTAIRYGLTVSAVILMFLLWGHGRWAVLEAQLLANVGTASQTRAELSVYRWPDFGVQDEVRRNGLADLSRAVKAYQATLQLDPGNVTANRRLAQIELSLGSYESARKHLEKAYLAAPDQRATRQLLGEAFAVSGNLEQAARFWRNVDIRHGQLDLRRWWYEHIGAQQELECMSQAMALLKTQTK